jgi:hypothetical protein
MIEAIVGSISCERVLVFLNARGEGYAREIAAFFSSSLAPIQKQLDKLEAGGVLASRTAGRTRLYTFNPRYPLLTELSALLEKSISFYDEELQQRLLLNRRRPRRRGKPL